MNSKIMSQYEERVKYHQNCIKELEEIKHMYEEIGAVMDRLGDIEVDVHFVSVNKYGKPKVFIKPPYKFMGEQTQNTKALFSHFVKMISSRLDEPPTIDVTANGFSQYIARWYDGQLELYVMDPIDCKTIEMVEKKEVKTLVPHPSCVAALKELENI